MRNTFLCVFPYRWAMLEHSVMLTRYTQTYINILISMVEFQFPLSNAYARTHTCSFITIQHFKQFIKWYFSLRFFPLRLRYKWFLLEGNDILAQTRNTVASSLNRILDVIVLNYSFVYSIFMGFKTPFLVVGNIISFSLEFFFLHKIYYTTSSNAPMYALCI